MIGGRLAWRVGWALSLALLLSACETLNPITLGIGVASYMATGKGLADHAIGTVMQQDCNLLGGILRADRKICEPHGSLAASHEFKGILADPSDPIALAVPALRLSDTLRGRPPEPAASDPLPESSGPSLRLSDSIEERVVPAPTPPRVARAGEDPYPSL